VYEKIHVAVKPISAMRAQEFEMSVTGLPRMKKTPTRKTKTPAISSRAENA
jgi:hypothetical protein